MIPRGRGNSSYRGGRGNPSNRGGRTAGTSNVLVQYGNKKLIASNVSGLASNEMEEFKKWKELQAKGNTPSSSKASYANMTQPEHVYTPNGEERVILLLNDNDMKWKDNPQILYDRYLSPHGYTMEAYKSRMFYEQILAANSCEFTHFTSGGREKQEVYNFSKILIKKIISIEDWGISPFREKTLVNNKGVSINYNYWDYIQAFDKAFYYENPSNSHTWFIKLFPEIYKSHIPSWFTEWWTFFGTFNEILPDFLQEYYDEWVQIKPENQINQMINDDLRFFIEYSIPWILKFSLKTGYTRNNFCLKRIAQTRFWEKMLRTDEEGQLNCSPTINLLKENIASYKCLMEEKKILITQKRIDYLSDNSSLDIAKASEEEIFQAYLLSLKKVLKVKKLEGKKSKSTMDKEDKKSSSDLSMASSDHGLFQDSQPDDTESIDEEENKDSIEAQLRRFLNNDNIP